MNKQFFYGNFENKIDAKGRVSIPANFRDLLAKDAGIEITAENKKVAIPFHLRPSPTPFALEICLQEYFTLWDARIQAVDMLDPMYNQLAASAYAGIVELSIDGDGRIILPKKERNIIQCTNKVMFIGLGRTFMIMEPVKGQKFHEESMLAPATISARPNTSAGGG